jgi:hypothetical protein
MATCDICNKDMLEVDGCKCNLILIGGVLYHPTPFISDDGSRCGDCNCKSESYHHPGCDMERCPGCGHQLISCGCVIDESAELFAEGEVQS